jgi:WD40 repeat protein
VQRLAFSNDERFLAGIGANNTFIIWDTRDGTPIHTRITEHPMTVLSWGDMITDKNPKHPGYTLITGNHVTVFINKLEFDISSMQYYLTGSAVQLPNTGLVRTYTFSHCNGDMLLTGTTTGEICIFSVFSSIYRASMPVSSNGIICGTVEGDSLYVGGGDGKLRKLSMSSGQWSLSHEAQLDSKVVSVNLSNDKKELIVGTSGGKMYRVLTDDLSFLLHSDSHTGTIKDISFGNNSDKFTAIDSQGAVKCWDLSDYKCTYTGYPAKPTEGTAVTIAKDDQSILTGWADGFLRCFVEGQGQIWEIANATRGAITSIYADANYILTGGADGAVRVWAR